MRIETKVTNRKEMAKAISEFTGDDTRYLGPPTFAYVVGNYVIDRNGTITSDLEEGEAELKQFLEEQGFMERPYSELNVTVPITDMDIDTLYRLICMLHSKQYLLNRAAGSPCFAVEKELLEALETNRPETKEAFLALVGAENGFLKGVDFTEKAVTFHFPKGEEAEKNNAFMKLASAMIKKAKESKRISPEIQKPENEKYYFRIWLIHLGFGGADGKEVRKALMTGLKGHSAFRTDEEAEKFKAEQKEKRAKKKAENAEA